ncbi:MAG: single-stranded DNA-binding protein [Bryobacteraceae bacterium]
MASRSVNKVILIGHLGRDAETRFTTGGAAKTTFSVATNRRWKDQQTGEFKEETDWHNIVLWRMENVATYLTKGVQVYIEGRLQTRNYEDKDGKKVYFTEVIGDNVILLGGRGADVAAASEEGAPARPASAPRGPQRVPSAAPAPAPAPAPEEGPGDIVSDDDLPF